MHHTELLSIIYCVVTLSQVENMMGLSYAVAIVPAGRQYFGCVQ